MILPLEVRVKKNGARYRSFAKTLRGGRLRAG